MSKVWRKLNRVGKKASKYKFTTFSHILKLTASSKWQPDNICITWTRGNRKISSKFAQWEPGLENPYEGNVYWEKSTDYIEFDVSLYRGINDDKFEDKDWSIFIENEEKGKRRLLATGKFHMNDYASIDPLFQTDIRDFNLNIASIKIKSASISFSLACQFLKEGKATDEDMLSIASYMSTTSTNNPYLNSNVMFNSSNKKHDRLSNNFDWDLDNDLHETSTEDNENNTTNKNEDNIDYYLKMRSISDADKFNNIGKIFEQTQHVESADFKKDFLESFDTMVIKNKESINEKNENKMMQNFEKISPIKESTKINDFSNPFSESDETINNSSNPFIDQKELTSENIDSNPFLSPTLTNSIEKDISNPFNENENSPASEKKRKNPVTKMINKAKSSTNIKSKKTNITLLNLNLSGTSKDLLDWCKNIIKSYKPTGYMPGNKIFQDLIINDFTKSWKNGLAFCAIMYHFKPILIDISLLNESEVKKNLSQVFKASDAEKIGRCVDYSDFKKDKIDQLLIMTYLFQLRDHFDSNTTERSQMLSPVNEDKPLEKSNHTPFNKKNKETNSNTSTPIKKIFKPNFNTNPYDNDPNENDENTTDIINNKTREESQTLKSDFQTLDFSPVSNPSKTSMNESNEYNNTRINNKSSELIHKAKELTEKNNQSLSTSRTENINEKVKKIINTKRKESMVRAASINKSIDKEYNSSNNNELNSDSINVMNSSSSIIGTEYVNQEIINFKNEQMELDEHADFLEKKLRSLMNAEKNKELEDKLLREWFLLINRKNALLIRQQELEIIQNEKNLEKRYELLSDKLRELTKIDEFNKSEEQKTAESILLNELISNVMERNDLVLQMDEENKLLNEGELIDEFIQNKKSFQHVGDEKGCSIQ